MATSPILNYTGHSWTLCACKAKIFFRLKKKKKEKYETFFFCSKKCNSNIGINKAVLASQKMTHD